MEYESHAPAPPHSDHRIKRCIDVFLDGPNLAAGIMIERPDDDERVENATIYRLEVENGAYRRFLFANFDVAGEFLLVSAASFG